MKSRMDRYYKNNPPLEESRLNKNKNAYEGTTEEDLENIDLTTNISVIDTDTTNMDLDKLKEYLNVHYSKNHEEDVDMEETLSEEKNIVDTKEYDLKKILDEARKNRESDYEKDRFKKLRDTQYDILKDLDLNRKEDPEIDDSLTREEATLMNLIKTVEDNATKAIEEKDLMSDLLSDDATEVLEPIPEDDEQITYEPEDKPSLKDELEKTIKIARNEIEEELEKPLTKEEVESAEPIEDTTTNTLNLTQENTFYTGQYKIKKSDYDDGSDDSEKEFKLGNIIIKILVGIIILLVIAVIVYFVDKYFKLGLFK